MPDRMPVLFIAHGAPPLLDDAPWMAELASWAQHIPRPRAILIVSAHWEAKPVTLGATRIVPLIYDFYGFPERYYQLKYASPGAPKLAARVRALLGAAGAPFADDPERGLDHGAYIPLVAMYPSADVPVLQMSLPTLDLRALYELGRTLAPLRDEGVLICGAGFLTHNLRLMGGGLAAWAQDFDRWVGDAILRGDVESLIRLDHPAAQTAHPRNEHYAPLLLAAGAATESLRSASFPIHGFWFGSFSKRSVQWG